MFLSHLGRSPDRVCGYRWCVLSGKPVIPTPVWSPSTVAYPVVDVLHFLHWDQSFIGINFHWDRIHWDQDFSGSKFQWNKIHWEQIHWERIHWDQLSLGEVAMEATSVGLKRSRHDVSCPSGWQPQVQLPRDFVVASCILQLLCGLQLRINQRDCRLHHCWMIPARSDICLRSLIASAFMQLPTQ